MSTGTSGDVYQLDPQQGLARCSQLTIEASEAELHWFQSQGQCQQQSAPRTFIQFVFPSYGLNKATRYFAVLPTPRPTQGATAKALPPTASAAIGASYLPGL